MNRLRNNLRVVLVGPWSPTTDHRLTPAPQIYKVHLTQAAQRQTKTDNTRLSAIEFIPEG